MVTCARRGWQSGGGLYIAGTAMLANTNIYSNHAQAVCSSFELPLTLCQVYTALDEVHTALDEVEPTHAHFIPGTGGWWPPRILSRRSNFRVDQRVRKHGGRKCVQPLVPRVVSSAPRWNAMLAAFDTGWRRALHRRHGNAGQHQRVC